MSFTLQDRRKKCDVIRRSVDLSAVVCNSIVVAAVLLELLQSLCGSIGILCTIPITAFIAAGLCCGLPAKRQKESAPTTSPTEK